MEIKIKPQVIFIHMPDGEKTERRIGKDGVLDFSVENDVITIIYEKESMKVEQFFYPVSFKTEGVYFLPELKQSPIVQPEPIIKPGRDFI